MSATFPQLMKDGVVSFNVKTETVYTVPVPEVNQWNRLFVLEECLWILSEDVHGRGSTNLYALEDCLKYKVHIQTHC
jgi:hypothetical protein